MIEIHPLARLTRPSPLLQPKSQPERRCLLASVMALLQRRHLPLAHLSLTHLLGGRRNSKGPGRQKAVSFDLTEMKHTDANSSRVAVFFVSFFPLGFSGKAREVARNALIEIFHPTGKRSTG